MSQLPVKDPKLLPDLFNHDYSDETARLVCERIVLGESQADICREKGMPSVGLVARWGTLNPNFAELLSLSLEARRLQYAEEVVSLARGLTDREDVKIVKVQIDALKWAASRKFGGPASSQSRKSTAAIGGFIIKAVE
jgi:hypothetical protein